MFNNNSNKDNGPVTDIGKYIDETNAKIVQILKNYGVAEKDLDKVMDAIFFDTRREMVEKYKFKEPYYQDEIEIKNSSKTSIEYLDVSHWHIKSAMVPFYQSLGDTIGYKNGDWEFNYDETNAKPDFVNDLIYEFIALGGINDISIVHWMASDDTVLYMATYKVLTNGFEDINDYGQKLRLAYLEAYPKMTNRGIGKITRRSLDVQQNIEWDKLPYSSTDIGAGSTMRSGCIGIFYPGKHNRKKLIALAVECSRITHNSATAILGSITAALFTAYSLEKVSINHWPHKLLNLLRSGKIDEYMKESRPNEYPLFSRDKTIFIGQWEKYITKRFNGLDPKNEKYMKNPVLRFKYLAENYSKGHENFAGSTGDDSVIMAYDALLESGDVIEKIIVYSILHPGDSDTVGSIALSWFGAYYHSTRNRNLLKSRFLELEFFDELDQLYQDNFENMVKVYFLDIYYDIARKYAKRYKKIKN